MNAAACCLSYSDGPIHRWIALLTKTNCRVKYEPHEWMVEVSSGWSTASLVVKHSWDATSTTSWLTGTGWRGRKRLLAALRVSSCARANQNIHWPIFPQSFWSMFFLSPPAGGSCISLCKQAVTTLLTFLFFPFFFLSFFFQQPQGAVLHCKTACRENFAAS